MGSPRENAAGKAGKPGARTQAQARARARAQARARACRLNQAADLREASLATWSELYYTIRIINHKIYKTYPEYA